MSQFTFNREDQRYGAARFSNRKNIENAGLFTYHPGDGNGAGTNTRRRSEAIFLGFFEGRPIYFYGDHIVTVGGAGSGKLRDLLSYNICAGLEQNAVIVDPRGELGAISIHTLARRGIQGFFWNIFGICGLPQHRFNLFSFLDPNSLYFHSDCKSIAETLIVTTGSANGAFFETRARQFLCAILEYIGERYGYVTAALLIGFINSIKGNPEKLGEHLTAMFNSRFEHVSAIAVYINDGLKGDSHEFSSVLSEVFSGTDDFNNPAILASFDGNDFNIEDLAVTNSAMRLYLNMPGDQLARYAKIMRLIINNIMQCKMRKPDAPRIVLLVDEAGQLKRFDTLVTAFTLARGYGVRVWALFQDMGQIVQHYGAPGIETFLGSAQVRQFFGIRDPKTAKFCADMLGNQTLEFNNTSEQQEAERRATEAIKRYLNGGDAASAAYEFMYYDRASHNRSKMQAPLLAAAEILNLPEDQQLLFISGLNLDPILANKYPYYTRPEMAGLYLPNPYHPPIDSVVVQTRNGPRRVRVMHGPVPDRYRLFPQYADGTALWLEGYPF